VLMQALTAARAAPRGPAAAARPKAP